jgi:hypothetical protein
VTRARIPSRYVSPRLSAACEEIDRDLEAPGHIAPFMVDERKEGSTLVLVLDATQIPVVTADESTRVLEQARALEEADGYWEPVHLAAVMSCHKASLYRDTPLMSLKELTPGGPRWRPSRVRALLALRSKSTPQRKVG